MSKQTKIDSTQAKNLKKCEATALSSYPSTQQTHNIVLTLIRRRCIAATSKQRYYDVVCLLGKMIILLDRIHKTIRQRAE